MSVPRRDIILNPDKPFSDAVLRGDTLYLSGRIGLIPGTSQVPESVAEEVHYLMQGFRAVLEKAEMTFDDLTYVQIFSPNVSLWQAFNDVYLTYFTGPLPARAFIGSGKLLFDARFEMQGIAVRS
ncbi:RidA family protein [Granulicella arctica]|uniref:RidA family protein n=1 Tax=Granulicella arctica TaxID=940613 RepID=UPI0021DFADEF|nr:Rid family hydrolase [Granulicella arctica]